MMRIAILAALLLCTPVEAAPAIPDYIQAAIANPHRPPEQVAFDARRKPEETIAFAGLKPGMRIGDFMPGSGYFTRIFSGVVGARGHVYAFVPAEEIKNCTPSETAGGLALAHDRNYPNVTVTVGPVDRYSAPKKLDMVWTAQNYHDLYDPFMGPADLAMFDRAVFGALKHGGIFLVIDHVAETGSGTRDTNTLHRIDPAVIVRDVTAAGFVAAGESDVLHNPADTHLLRVFDPAIRGHTDQVVLKFVKP